MTVGATASATGIDPTDMTVLNGMVLFNGVDANGLSGLWAWNGTSATELVAGGEPPARRLEPDRHDGLRKRSAVERPRSER